MLTSFFGKSSPVNYLLLGLYMLTVTVLQGIHDSNFEWSAQNLAILGSNAMLLLFSMLLVDFFIRKNTLTQSNTYGIFCFSTASLFFPLAMDWKILLSLLFVLLGLRRMFSLHSGKNSERKLLDASLWFFIASYFYAWNLVWFIPLFAGLFSIKNLKFKFFLIPPLTGIAVFLIGTAYFLMVNDSYDWIVLSRYKISLNFVNYGIVSLIVGITVLLTFFIWSLVFRFGSLNEIPKKYKSNYVLVIYVSFTGILAALLANTKTGSELILLVPGMALVLAGYLERQIDFWLRELMMWILLLLPIVLIFIA